MKALILLISILIFTSGCSKKEEQSKNEVPKENSHESSTGIKEKEMEKTVNTLHKELYGYYTGDFKAEKYKEGSDLTYTNRITISIDSVNDKEVYGHSVVAGNKRPFSGVLEQMADKFNVTVAEPGDDKYDGKFTFEINPAIQAIKGTWKSYDPNLLVTERSYELPKKEYSYNPEQNLPANVEWQFLYEKDYNIENIGESLTKDVTKINASTKLLTKKDVENMHKGDLEIIRNSIYARHGYSFKTRRIRYIFDRYVDWYMPVSDDVRNELTEIELKNIELIKRFEQYADKHYDTYGR